MAAKTDIRFRDLVRREEKAVIELESRREDLKKRKVLTPAEKLDLKRVEAVLSRLANSKVPELADPLFVAVRDYLNANPGLLGATLSNHRDGLIQGSKGQDANGNAIPLDAPTVVRLSLILGFLDIDESPLPRVSHQPTSQRGDVEIKADPTDPTRVAFSKSLFAALGEAQGAQPLAELVLPFLERVGDSDESDQKSGEVAVAEFARVMRCLIESGVTIQEPQLKRKVDQCLDKIQLVGVNRPLSDTAIALPNFDQVADSKIPPENIRQAGLWICVAMFRELKVYQVVEKILSDAQDGTVALGLGKANDLLYQYWKNAPNRISDFERENILARILGIPGGSNPSRPGFVTFNSDFTRGCAATSSFVRQAQADRILRAKIPASINQQQLRKPWRDFIANLSSHTFGMSHLLAREEQVTINTIIELLSNKELLAAYGAPDMRGLIDQVAMLDLGGLRSSARLLSMATSGGIITAWLADHVDLINQPTGRRLIDIEDVLSMEPATAGSDATRHPTDYDFVNACELWLLDTAQSDEVIENLATKPTMSPDVSSRPIQIPSIAREMLQQAGVPGLGLGLGMNPQR